MCLCAAVGTAMAQSVSSNFALGLCKKNPFSFQKSLFSFKKKNPFSFQEDFNLYFRLLREIFSIAQVWELCWAKDF